jgi:hypothetical protein
MYSQKDGKEPAGVEQSVVVEAETGEKSGPVRGSGRKVFDQIGQLELAVGTTGVFEVDDPDPPPVPQVVGKIRVGVTEHGGAGGAEAKAGEEGPGRANGLTRQARQVHVGHACCQERVDFGGVMSAGG